MTIDTYFLSFHDNFYTKNNKKQQNCKVHNTKEALSTRQRFVIFLYINNA